MHYRRNSKPYQENYHDKMNAQLSRKFMEWEVNIAICTKTDVTPLIALGFDDNKSY